MNLASTGVLLILSFFYLSLSLVLWYGLNKRYERNENQKLSVSVIVAARNEANHIKKCLSSLSQLDYPHNLLEIIIINDRSQDKTHKIITQFIKDQQLFRYAHVEEENPILSGKANAISHGINLSKGEIIFITDADCIVPVTWVKRIVSYFTKSVGLVASFTLLENSNRIFDKLQNLDWAYMLSVAAGSIGLDIPLTCMGNNFALRRPVYEKIGGYKGVGFSVTEDFALLKAVAERTDWKVVFPICSDCLVISQPVKTLKEFFTQRKRWAIGGQSVHWFGKILITISIILHYFLIAFFFVGQNHAVGLLSVLFILLADYLLLFRSLNRLNFIRNLKYLPLYKLFFIFYSSVLLVFLIFSKKVTWKDVKYR